MAKEYERRRTFAIISHPDAGKTTLTEKLLLYGGAIHSAGAVKARRAQRSVTSDWMELEKKRGISVTSSVLQFELGNVRYNLLDTPGHKDFSEDTYRTLTAADCAIMLIDAAKGVEEQTKKLFAVCRMRGTPIVTFVNKLDRPARDPFELMSEVEEVLGLATVPITWPVGSGDLFKGVYDLQGKRVLTFERTKKNATKAPVKVGGIDDPQLRGLLGEEQTEELTGSVELLAGAGDTWDRERFLAGEISPVFFGSALTNFGVEPFLEDFAEICPPPGPRNTNVGRSRRATTGSPRSFSRCKPTWTRPIATGSRSCGSAAASSRAGYACIIIAWGRRSDSRAPSSCSPTSGRPCTRRGRATSWGCTTRGFIGSATRSVRTVRSPSTRFRAFRPNTSRGSPSAIPSSASNCRRA